MKKLSRIDTESNAYTLSFDDSLLEEIRSSHRSLLEPLLTRHRDHLLEGGKVFDEPINATQDEYYIASYGASPLLWFSCNTYKTYDIYKRFFDSLQIEDDVKSLVDYNDNIVMYCGFLVISDRAPESIWHVDYDQGSNAYTLITPLFELDNDHGNLLYKTSGNAVHRYDYKLDEAIIFGDNFSHTTEPYTQSRRLRVLLSLTFGTDKLEYWPILEKTVGVQSGFIIQPCGHRNGTCDCLDVGKDETPQPGRNDKCYCGSEKKYKHCHGATG